MRSRIFFRYLAFSLEIILLLVLQSTPKLFPEICGSKPFLLLAAALSLAAVEDVIPSLVLGAVCGVAADLSANGGVGFFAVMFTLVCFAVSSVTDVYLNRNIITFSVLSLGAVIVVIGLYFIFFRLLAGVPDSGALFVNHYLSRILYTFVISVPLYFLNGFLKKRLNSV